MLNLIRTLSCAAGVFLSLILCQDIFAAKDPSSCRGDRTPPSSPGTATVLSVTSGIAKVQLNTIGTDRYAIDNMVEVLDSSERVVNRMAMRKYTDPALNNYNMYAVPGLIFVFEKLSVVSWPIHIRLRSSDLCGNYIMTDLGRYELPVEAADTTAPTIRSLNLVTINSPNTGKWCHLHLTTVDDQAGVDRVEYFIDDQRLMSDSPVPPLEFENISRQFQYYGGAISSTGSFASYYGNIPGSDALRNQHWFRCSSGETHQYEAWVYDNAGNRSSSRITVTTP